MEKNPHMTHTNPTASGLIRLQARVTSLATWLSPAWAALCGVIASEGFRGESNDWLQLALLILLIDGGWGTLWTMIVSTNWAAPFRQWRTWEFGEKTPKLPYTMPDSPGDRVLGWIGLFRAWWRHLFWLDCGHAILTIIIALPIITVLALLLKPDLLLLSIGALAIMQLGLIRSGGHGETTPSWNAIIAIALPWMAGHIAFGALTTSSSLLALSIALAWGAGWHAASFRGQALITICQVLAAAILITLRHPLSATCLILLLVPQLALLPWVKDNQRTDWYVRHTHPWLMATMLITAWTL
jgi:hypothetical protein